MNIQECQRFDMPKDALPLTAQIQGRLDDRISLWMEVETDNTLESIPVYIIGTGNSFPKDTPKLKYVASVQMGYFVWHVYIAVGE